MIYTMKMSNPFIPDTPSSRSLLFAPLMVSRCPNSLSVISCARRAPIVNMDVTILNALFTKITATIIFTSCLTTLNKSISCLVSHASVHILIRKSITNTVDAMTHRTELTRFITDQKS